MMSTISTIEMVFLAFCAGFCAGMSFLAIWLSARDKEWRE